MGRARRRERVRRHVLCIHGGTMKRLVVMAVMAIAALAGPAAAAQADSNEYGNSLCQQRPYMCVDPMTSIGANGTYTGPRRAFGDLHVEAAGHGRQGPDLLRHAAEGSADEAQPGRYRRHLELPAAGDVLARPDHVRLAVVAELHAYLQAQQRRQRTVHEAEPEVASLHRQGAGQRLHGAAVLHAGLGVAVQRVRLLGHQVVREHDHRQLFGVGQHERPAERRLPEQPTSWSGPSRSTGRT